MKKENMAIAIRYYNIDEVEISEKEFLSYNVIRLQHDRVINALERVQLGYPEQLKELKLFIVEPTVIANGQKLPMRIKYWVDFYSNDNSDAILDIFRANLR